MAGANGQKRVLLIALQRRDAPNAVATDAIHRRILGDALGGRLDYYSEYLDIERFADSRYQAALRTYLRTRYDGVHFDVVVATTSAVLRLVRRDGDDLFPGVPVVFGGGANTSGGSRSTGVTSHVDLVSTIEIARALQPDLQRVVVVSGASAIDREYGAIARRQLQALEHRLSFEYLEGQTFGELERRLATLPRTAAVYYIVMTEDGAGERLVARDAMARLSAASSVPVYGWHDAMAGHGIVGGRLFSSDVVAEHTARLALRVLQGEDPDRIPVTAIDPYVLRFDWRQLRRWGLSEARLPATSVVMNREQSVWSRYRIPIAGAVLVVLLQSAFIVGLVVQRARRRRVESALRAREADLRRSYEQRQDLAGRLLSAQEVERARIARELHDGISQEVAHVLVELALLKRRAATTAGSGLTDELDEIYGRVAALAESVRTLSHDLHPASLKHVGLAAALRAHCMDVERSHGLEVHFNGGDAEPDSDDCALSLYRIAQEALRNTCRHAGARRATVSLERVGDGLNLTVTDDGRGFDVAARGSRGGLGLVSMDERARLIGGTMQVLSQPGRGVQVRVHVPVADRARQRAGGLTARLPEPARTRAAPSTRVDPPA